MSFLVLNVQCLTELFKTQLTKILWKLLKICTDTFILIIPFYQIKCNLQHSQWAMRIVSVRNQQVRQ